MYMYIYIGIDVYIEMSGLKLGWYSEGLIGGVRGWGGACTRGVVVGVGANGGGFLRVWLEVRRACITKLMGGVRYHATILTQNETTSNF